ncbi:MAG: AraC family transcriptional regulator [Tissierellia bacterium]|nr:AraC family transcriptional regulator [Tissierellia bacterium]
MDSENRQDFTFDLWGDPRHAHYDGNRVTFSMNPKYGEGVSIVYDSPSGIYPNYAKYKLDFKLEKNDIVLFKQNSIWIGKLLNGKLLMKTDGNMSILFNEGDVFCLSGNYILNKKFHYNTLDPVELVGIFSYHNDIINAFEKNYWIREKILNILENPKLKSGILLNRTYEIEDIIQRLHQSIIDDIRYDIFVEGNNLFNCFIKMMQNKEHIKTSSYTQEQADIVIEIKSFLDKNLDQYYSMPKLAEIFNISLSRMQIIFKNYYNMSPYKYHLYKRLDKANEIILNTDIKITTIAESLGFTSYDNFFKAYKSRYGCNPSNHRKR